MREMEIAYWVERWREGRIGFHEGRTNAFLARHVDRIGTAPRRVLVPLCGKTEDMAFLASRGHHVIGIEAVEDAVQAFFREHALTPEVREVSKHIRRYTAGQVTIFAGDVFACNTEVVGDVDAFYDRAALVALTPDVRARYVAHLRALLAPKSTGLVVTFDYEQAKMSAPPYAVSAAELHRLYEGATITELGHAPVDDNSRFRDAGVTATEHCFAIEL
ncbi:MAG TPA: thiopurine S-methyltransferase [Labilithrix sp.]|jgi:thiopurine S-methyltransferase|nr:thiopurine S-methyltransferase [Labilithrix sp.]